MTAEEAREAILNGTAPNALEVKGYLNLGTGSVPRQGAKSKKPTYDPTRLRALPEYLVVDNLDLTGCTGITRLPSHLTVRRQLVLDDCAGLTELPNGLWCGELSARRVPLKSLPDDIQVSYRLELEGCTLLERLPDGLKVGILNLRGCTSLAALPEGLSVNFLDISGCISLSHLPEQASFAYGHFTAVGCWQIKSLPAWVNPVAQLNVRDCVALTSLPNDLVVSSSLDIGDTSIGLLPEGTKKARLLWRGVPIDERIAFQPETITSNEVLAETNVERRRVLMERMGYEAFLEAAQAKVLDSDFDAGGRRQLLHVTIPNDEPLVCLSVHCPSTGRQYMLRVPPNTRSCRHGSAWLAGFDNVDDYQPLMET